MIAVILAAGYATRLYPLTLDKPKSLLDVGGKAILAHILDKLEEVREVREIVIVTNHKFYGHFTAWIDAHPPGRPTVVIDDHTTTEQNRLGAVADLAYAVAAVPIDDDLLVLAGDNLFDFALTDFVAFFRRVGHDAITVHTLDDPAALRRTGVVVVDAGGRVLDFAEKPSHPRSNLAAPPFYIYRRDTLPLLSQYLVEGNDRDAPGSFIPWLIEHREVHAFPFKGHRYDIGTPESYDTVKKLFAGRP